MLFAFSMIPPMRSARTPRRFAPLTFGLALWLALPSLEWCPLTWDACWSACEAAAASGPTSCTLDAKRACAAGADARLPTNSTLLPCDPEPAALPAGDRAWCIHPPLDGVPTRGPEMPLPIASLVLAVMFDPPRLQAPPRGRTRLERRAVVPGRPDSHAPPPSRAPPLGFPSNLF